MQSGRYTATSAPITETFWRRSIHGNSCDDVAAHEVVGFDIVVSADAGPVVAESAE